MDRKSLKIEAKSLLNKNFLYFFQLYLIVIILSILNTASNGYSSYLSNVHWTSVQSSGLFVALILSLFITSSEFASLDILRDNHNLTQPFSRSLTVFKRSDVLWGTIAVGLLIFIWTFLWSLLLIIPGIIKALAYSQATFIYRDHLLSGNPIKYTEAVTLSRELMNGHKWDFFVFNLSFIGYWLLVIVTFGIAEIWVLPYYSISCSNYYIYLTK